MFPGRTCRCRARARRGTTRIAQSAHRRVDGRLRAPARRAPGGQRPITCTQNSRDMPDGAEPEPAVCASTPNVNTSRCTADRQPGADRCDGTELRRAVPGLRALQRPAVTQFVNIGRIDYDALMMQLQEALQPQLQRPGVLHLRRRARQLLAATARRAAASRSARRHAPRAERGADRRSTSATTSRSAAQALVPHDRRA